MIFSSEATYSVAKMQKIFLATYCFYVRQISCVNFKWSNI